MPASAARQRGVLSDWNDDRGFGFITSTIDGSRSFVHVSAFPRDRRPSLGSAVTYVEARDDRNRSRAEQVQYVSGAGSPRRHRSRTSSAVGVAAAFFGLLAVLVVIDKLPVTMLVAYVVFSALTFMAYDVDKEAATKGQWRTPESTLHLLALIGGWPGALIAQQALRHKTKKQPFRTVFWLTVIANCVALAWFVHEAPLSLP